MSKKNVITLTVTILAVAGFYFYMYGDGFHKATIQISHTIRPKPWALTRPNPAAGGEEGINAITFRMEQKYQLTSVKVVAVPELETNKYAHPVWELATTSNSLPIQTFYYGMHIRGMHPTVKGATAVPLTPNVPYRLIVAAGSTHGEHDFTITDSSRLAQ